jgi:hypothetical protein
VLGDSVRSLSLIATRLSESGLKTTLPYLTILNYVASLSRTAASEAVQFVIVETFGHYPDNTPRLVMQSEIHGLDSGSSPLVRAEPALTSATPSRSTGLPDTWPQTTRRTY